MSHLVERTEKNCLNCGAYVYGRYCHACGQENVEPRESFWHLVTHFAYDVTHFDSKFFSTLKYLLFRPGFLAKEYIKGKRVTYLNPIKMYVFISAFFFLYFFSVISPAHKGAKEEEVPPVAELREDIETRLEAFRETAEDKDTPDFTKRIARDQIPMLEQDLETLKHDTTHLKLLNYYKLEGAPISTDYRDVQYYDSVQNTLPEGKRDGWFKRLILRKNLSVKSHYGTKQEFWKEVLEKYRHSFPQVMFLSLPLFALLLKLLYLRRKGFFYVDHVVFSIHLYAAMFILMFFLLTFAHFEDAPYLHWLVFLRIPLLVYVVWYQYKSLKNFYEQSSKKTALKYVLLVMLSTVVMPALFLLFLVLSIFNM